jgi:hypothetical protein
MINYVPYTYLIGWSKHNKWYYGCQYGVNANPSNLWNIYFTSSKKVKTFRKEFGDPDIIQIRRTFKTKESARLWEHRVIERTNAVSKDKWLNAGNGGKEFLNKGGYKLSESTKMNQRKPKPEGFGEKISKAKKGVPGVSGASHPMFGRKQSYESRQLMSDAKKDKYVGKDNPFFGKQHSIAMRQHLSDRAKSKLRLTCPQCNKTMDSSNFKKYNHGLECKRFICL